MQVIVSSGPKFHALHLAEQLDKRGYLKKLITMFYSKKRGWFPEFRKDLEIINPQKVVTNSLPALFFLGLKKAPIINNLKNWDYFLARAFENWAKTQIEECDIFIAWSSWALDTIRVAKSFGAITILERGSAHILYQKEILEEEYNKFGLKIKPVDERNIQRELCEYNEADYLTVQSEFAKQTYIKKGINEKKLFYVPTGVDLKFFKKVPKEDNTFRIIYVGALILRKGLQYLFEAFSQLKLKNSELLLIGNYSTEVNSLLKRYSGCYKYIGKIKHYELYKYYSQGSVFVLPSVEDGFAHVVTEAMACGLPIICTENTGAKDLITDGKEGYIIPIRDVKSLKEKLVYLYENPDVCKNMGLASMGKIKSGFDWDSYGEKITAEFSRLISERKNRL